MQSDVLVTDLDRGHIEDGGGRAATGDRSDTITLRSLGLIFPGSIETTIDMNLGPRSTGHAGDGNQVRAAPASSAYRYVVTTETTP